MAYSDPLGFSIIWTTYGTWLPGDPREWVQFGAGKQSANPHLERWCGGEMNEPFVTLDNRERGVVNRTIAEVCRQRCWECRIANARTNHVHVVVSAHEKAGKQVRDTLKAWCTRRLKERQEVLLKHLPRHQLSFECVRQHWWTEGGYAKPLYTQAELDAAVIYAGEVQDLGGSKGNRPMPGVDYLKESPVK